ncbi:MAG: methyltransferase domain-containing protein [Actinomycetota bacterium]|nr:methyltransferase domain-containing protein [Actinomycetota bacterium]
MGGPATWQERVEEFVLGQIGNPTARVLEAGCGKGELARTLARAGHCVTAIDPRAPEGRIFRRVRIESSPIPARSTTWRRSCPCTTSKTSGRSWTR